MPDDVRLPDCPDCDYDGSHSTGYTPEANEVARTFYALGPSVEDRAAEWCDKITQAETDMLVEKGRLRELAAREPTEDNPRRWEWRSVPRTAEEVNAANRPGARALDSNLYHDGINSFLLIDFRLKTLGIERSCRTCGGEGTVGTPEERAAYMAWEGPEPPEGEGWQLWETVSEGSPVTPVFADAEGLIGHLVRTEGYREEAARSLVTRGFTFGTMIVSDGVLLDSAKDADRI